MTKPVVILDPNWRSMSELFSASALDQFRADFDVVWGQDDPIPDDVLEGALPQAVALIAAEPKVDAAMLAKAPKLRAVIEVSGAFPDTIDYAACQVAGVEVLSCSPGFREAVAEMGLGMAIAASRGLISQHEAFRTGGEQWLEDRATTDFSLYGADVGIIGFGQIGQELARILVPFRPTLRAFDPWLPPQIAEASGVELCDLETLMQRSRCLFVAAVPTADNEALLSKEMLSHLADHSLVVLLSRAHVVDFAALTAEAQSGRLTVATDVYPSEPLTSDHPLRTCANVVLSPHRAAAVQGGRQLIGDLILRDLKALTTGQPTRELVVAQADKIAQLAGIGDASQVQDMASSRTT